METSAVNGLTQLRTRIQSWHRKQEFEIQHRYIKNSKLIPFHYSGHGLFYEQKDLFNRELMNFVEE